MAWVGTLSAALFLGLRRLALLRLPHHIDLAAMGGAAAAHPTDDASTNDDGSLHGGAAFIPGKCSGTELAEAATAATNAPASAAPAPDL